jgi:hypothetical protein
MLNNVSTLILENYDVFVKDHGDLFEEALSAVSTITDDSYYEMYIDKLMEGLDESTVRRVKPLLDREREMYIEEATSILTSPQAIAYAVASFPMLINIYADPMLSKVVTVYPYDKPTMTIPRLRWVAKVIDEQGNATEYLFPTATQMVRPQFKTLTVGQSGNLFNLLNVQKGDFRISKRNFRVVSIDVDNAGTAETIMLGAQADARGNIMYEFKAGTGTYKLQAQVNFETGDVTWSVVTIVADANITIGNDIDVKFRMFGNGNGRQVVKSYPRQDIIDIDADIEDSFEVENIEEVIQDWKALYDINILAELKNHVKDQIKLNRDYEIAELLDSNIPFAQTIGQYVEVDFSSFKDGGATGLRPVTIQDIFKNFVPALNALVERMRRQNNMEVQYLVTSVDTAAVLKSLQEFSLKMEGLSGMAGTSGSVGAFAKLEIIESYAVTNDMIHVITEAATLGLSSIVMVMYKPLYIITETTNSIRRTFIKSRTWLGIVRPEGIGHIKFVNYEEYFGIYTPYTP